MASLNMLAPGIESVFVLLHPRMADGLKHSALSKLQTEVSSSCTLDIMLLVEPGAPTDIRCMDVR